MPLITFDFAIECFKQNDATQMELLLNARTLNDAEQETFHTVWGEKGHRVREALNNDFQLENLLLRCLPPYKGGDIRLFRGENRERYKDQKTGFCWTSKKEIAEMFARGLNAVNGGGLVLSGVFEKPVIIAAPSKHSVYLGEYEYTLAVSKIKDCDILCEYPDANIYK